MSGLQLIATGGAIPGRTVTNEDLSRMVDTSDEWITSRTGIRTRHWCTEDESAATLAISAAKQALARSGLAPAQIGCCICATLSAPDATPSVACQVQAALSLPENCPALDVNAACSGHFSAVGHSLCSDAGRARQRCSPCGRAEPHRFCTHHHGRQGRIPLCSGCPAQVPAHCAG